MRSLFRSTAVVASLLVASSAASAQAAAKPALSRDEITAMAKLFVSISRMHDSVAADLAKSRNKTLQAQQQLRDLQRTQREEILHHAGMTDVQYQQKTFLLSTNGDARKTFDSVVAVLTGVPTPGQAPPTPPGGGRGAPVPVPAGPVGTHIGHVVNAFGDTPEGMGLLAAAMAETRIAAQHATLAGRDPANLGAMQLHAGHVIHALDPTIVTMGPGRGYGLKRAATGVATHIELAAKAAGASPNVLTHSAHIATAARNTVDRADQLIAIAKQVQAATTAADAAALVSQMASLSDQLVKGADTNADGKITWEKGEGGLQQAQEHATLMLAAEKPAH